MMESNRVQLTYYLYLRVFSQNLLELLLKCVLFGWRSLLKQWLTNQFTFVFGKNSETTDLLGLINFLNKTILKFRFLGNGASLKNQTIFQATLF